MNACLFKMNEIEKENLTFVFDCRFIDFDV